MERPENEREREREREREEREERERREPYKAFLKHNDINNLTRVGLQVACTSIH